MVIDVPNLEETFYTDIEFLVKSSNNSYLDCIIHWCEEKGIEIEYIAPLITKNLGMRAKLQGEGEKLNFLKKTTRVPI